MATLRPRHRIRRCLLSVSALAAVLVAGCNALDDRPAPVEPAPYTAAARSHTSTLLTTARPTFGAVVNEYFDVRSTPVQPIEFPHNIHVEQGITCAEFCHESVTKGPQAGLPSVNTCLICHIAIATDKPRIQQITALQEKGLDLAWQRVFGYTDRAHVRFNHAPHIRASVECVTCHGDIASQTVAQRNITLGMGDCVSCHSEQNASNDCLTCHY